MNFIKSISGASLKKDFTSRMSLQFSLQKMSFMSFFGQQHQQQKMSFFGQQQRMASFSALSLNDLISTSNQLSASSMQQTMVISEGAAIAPSQTSGATSQWKEDLGLLQGKSHMPTLEELEKAQQDFHNSLLLEESFFSLHRPLIVDREINIFANNDWLVGEDQVQKDQDNLGPKVIVVDGLDNPIDDYMISFPTTNQPSSSSPMLMINILKRRRKKMNKHKWKKYRREVRNSTRYFY